MTAFDIGGLFVPETEIVKRPPAARVGIWIHAIKSRCPNERPRNTRGQANPVKSYGSPAVIVDIVKTGRLDGRRIVQTRLNEPTERSEFRFCTAYSYCQNPLKRSVAFAATTIRPSPARHQQCEDRP